MWVVLCAFKRKGHNKTIIKFIIVYYMCNLYGHLTRSGNKIPPDLLSLYVCMFEKCTHDLFPCPQSQNLSHMLDIYCYLCILSTCDLFQLTFSGTQNVPRASQSGLKMMPCIKVASHTLEISLFYHGPCSRSKYW